MSWLKSHKVSAEIDGRIYSLETGKLAKFANGSIMIRCGDTMVLVVATASNKEMEGIDFLPLQVEYKERMSASGKIPGGFLKREGRPSEKEILVSRLIDRPCRPMFPKGWYYDTQIVAQVYSAEKDIDPENIAATAASAALMISDIPFNGPISEVRVGRIEGEFILNPTPSQLEESNLDFTLAGTDSSIVMVEGESNEISEEEFLSALKFGHEKIREFNNLQRELMKLVSKEKREITIKEIPEEIFNSIEEGIKEDLLKYINSDTSKEERNENRNSLKEKALEIVEQKFGETEEYEGVLTAYANQSFTKLEKQYMRNMILKEGQRLDGRSLIEIRPIETEIGLLPRNHGSSLFTRGETQSLTSVTLGTSRDEQMVDGLLPTYTNKFFLHYNFPPFSVGETGRLGFTGRREIGHGHLAERALKKLLNFDEDSFPYTIRVVSDILESNGSSSMATVCAGSLALMDAGVPISKPCAGIAMGLIKDNDDVAILSDILGDEDFLGDMDFKVAGSADGITACQMDIKIEGISFDIIEKALEQAKEGRMHILEKMAQTITSPRTELSKFAPRFTTYQVDKSDIGAIIGSGGENIRALTKISNTEINIDDDGLVTIAALNDDDVQIAIQEIKKLIEKPEEGKVYTAKIVEIREGLGAIIEFLPKKKGLLHISEIQWERTNNVADILKEGEEIEVKLLEITHDGKYRFSKRELTEKPDWYKEKEESGEIKPRERSNRNDRRGGPSKGNYGNRGRNDRRN